MALEIVFTTVANGEQAEKLATTLINEQVAACVSTVPGIQSTYRWEGTIERSSEVLLLIKCTAEHRARLMERIKEIHPYTTPEIVALSAAAVSDAYLAWAKSVIR